MIKLVSSTAMRLADNEAILSGVSAIELIRRAAEGLANALPKSCRIAIVCGEGNNGGDGYALSSILLSRGILSDVYYINEPKTAAAKHYFHIAKNEKGICFMPIKIGKLEFIEYDVIYDCLFGTGARFLNNGAYAEVVKAINASGAFIISCDINSGLDADNGLVNGVVAVQSNITVSIGTIKTGLMLHDARDYIKKISNENIGIEIISDTFAIEDEDIRLTFPHRKSHSNKGTYGRCGIYGGCEEYSGAIKLANLAQGAMRLGCGLCSLLLTPTLLSIVAPFLLESTVKMVSEKGQDYDFDLLDKGIDGLDSLLFGTGSGQSEYNIRILEHLLENYTGKLIIDADGLNCLSAKIDVLKNAKCSVIITPHVKEMERLTGITISEIKKNAIEIAKEFAKKYNIIVILKDNTTVITDGDITYISTSGTSAMAKGGSGDALAGAILGKVAQKIGNDDILLSVATTVYLVGKAGENATDVYGEYSANPSDTIGHIGRIITKFTE